MSYTIIVLLLFTFDLVFSMSSSPYEHYKIEELCPTNPFKVGFDLLAANKPEIKLNEFDKPGAVVRQSWSPGKLKKLHDCTFKVVVPENRHNNLLNPSKVGIYAFVHRLNLRKTTYRFRSEDDCLDHVQFANSDLTKGTNQICGKYISDGGYHTEDQKHWFASNGRSIRVTLDLNKYIPMDESEPLELVIVFTVFTSNCNSSMIECAPNQCISKAFADDTFLNCPPQSCQDEKKCLTDVLIEQAQQPYGINSTNIAISAITSLIITMTAVFCVYVCCKYHWCRKNSLTNNSGRRNGGNNGDDSDLAVGAINNRRGPPGQRVIESEYSSINAATSSIRPTTSTAGADSNSHLTNPTAPILDDDKDKPPSYDSLFSNKMGDNHTNVGITQPLPSN